jgi:hypothetical protein
MQSPVTLMLSILPLLMGCSKDEAESHFTKIIPLHIQDNRGNGVPGLPLCIALSSSEEQPAVSKGPHSAACSSIHVTDSAGTVLLECDAASRVVVVAIPETLLVILKKQGTPVIRSLTAPKVSVDLTSFFPGQPEPDRETIKNAIRVTAITDNQERTSQQRQGMVREAYRAGKLKSRSPRTMEEVR